MAREAMRTGWGVLDYAEVGGWPHEVCAPLEGHAGEVPGHRLLEPRGRTRTQKSPNPRPRLDSPQNV